MATRICMVFWWIRKINIFSNPEDLKMLKKLNMNLCLDVSHYLLSCNYNEISPYKFLKNILDYLNIFIFQTLKVLMVKVSAGDGDLKNSKI